MRITRRVTVERPISEVFSYLSDFTTTTEWDPGTVRTTRESGDGGPGTRYHTVSRVLGRRTELTYLVTEFSPPRRLVLRGENHRVVALDTIALEATPSGRTRVTYESDFTFRGWVRLIAPLTAPALRSLGDRAADGMRSALAPTPS
jgi:uncharacterized protein YndB with AHSA1/START domain